MDRLSEKCERRKILFDSIEKEFFFGIYTDSIKEFKVLRGERLQVIQMANILQSIFQEKGLTAFAQHFDVPKRYRFDKSDMTELSVGLFYGKRIQNALNQLVLDRNEVSVKLLSKLKVFFNGYAIKQCQPISEESITITDIDGNGMRADVICVFCESNKDEPLTKRHAIQYDKTGNWNLSNLRKHVKLHLVKEQENGEKDVVNIDDENSADGNIADVKQEIIAGGFLNASPIMELPVVLSNESQIEDDKSETMDVLYKQFCAQNLKLLRATLQHNEQKKFMVSKIDGRSFNITTLSIAKDGNCLFSAISHQLECVKTGSNEHKAFAINLRKKIVEHIQNNIDQFAQALKYRDNSEIDVEPSGSEFISSDLCKDGVWGGTETLLATSRIFEVNIVVFKENGPFYFAIEYNPKYSRCIFIAYRSLGRKDKNELPVYDHYESVSEISEDLLYKCAKDFAEKLDKIFICD